MSWCKDLENGMQTGDENDTNQIFVSLKKGNIYHGSILISDDKEKTISTLILMTVYIPLEQRNQGIFKDILDTVEKKAKNNRQHLFVGPFMTDDSQWIQKVCKQRNYQPAMPFGYFKNLFNNTAK